MNQVEVSDVVILSDSMEYDQLILSLHRQKASKVEIDTVLETVRCEFNAPLEKGREMCLKMSYKGIHNDQMAGFYRSGYKDDQGNKK